VRVANRGGRAQLVEDGRCLDVERASNGRFASDPMAALASWAALRDWAAGRPSGDGETVDPSELGPPVPRPAQVFGVGVNYRAHVREAGMEAPATPMIFTKFPSCLVGPRADVHLSSDYVDWEVELVVVIGARTHRVPEERALEHVAGYCVGQDVSDRKLQFSDKPPQFSLGKSLATFGPTGPAVVTLDELTDPLDLAITCEVSGEPMQEARTSDMIFSVPALVAYLSGRCTLAAGDLVFTGTPAGVGSVRTPRRYLRAGDVVHSAIEGLGVLENRCVARE
jgi:2-keto-4-pentenoate hydratase/2-oxohepta-3-ene-1,7-dioic acid hydratase in catechol pathway